MQNLIFTDPEDRDRWLTLKVAEIMLPSTGHIHATEYGI